MTATIPGQVGTTTAPADEIQVILSPPTQADAQLIVQMQAVAAATGANRGFERLTLFDAPPTLGQLRKRHAKDSSEYSEVMAFLEAAETASTFVRHGLLNEALVN